MGLAQFFGNLFHRILGNGLFWNHDHESIQVMHGLRKLIPWTSKMAEEAEKYNELVERNCVLFYLIIVVSEGNQAQLELFSEVF